MTSRCVCDRCGGYLRVDETGYSCPCDQLSDEQLRSIQLSAEAALDNKGDEARIKAMLWAVDKVLATPRRIQVEDGGARP